ncbi:ABC transporter permease subunit [bacterium 210820-DFI.6.37]|nr:ABC transporter permease subunit [bacterium 210820-DFI.6.37]
MIEIRKDRKLEKQEILIGLVPLGTLAVIYAAHTLTPNVYPEDYEATIYPLFLQICMIVYGAFAAGACYFRRLKAKLLHLSWLLSVLFILIEFLDIATLKTGWLELPFIPSPDKILATAVNQYAILTESFVASMKLLFTGLFFGVITGLLSGVLIGWSKICNYWFTPVMKIIGPMPSAAWLPIVMVIFPTGHAAGVFLIALSVWFPLTLNFSSAIRNTDKRLIETARVLGASEQYILLRVAIPAAVPSIFTGLFMGFSMSFGALVVAEMLGVKAGLGWYISWSQSWAEYGRLFFTVLIFIIIFSLLMSLLFKVRDKLLKWQKGSVRW